MHKAARGHPIQISAANVHKNTHTLHLHPEIHRKVHRAKISGKEVCLHLIHHEMHDSGLLDWLKYS